MADASRFVDELPDHVPLLRREAESTTRHGRLLRIEPHQVGRDVILAFCYHTGDAQGMNMIVKATDRACAWLMTHGARA